MAKRTSPGSRAAVLAATVLAMAAWASPGHADLVGRDLDGNLGTIEAYYDTVLGITWLVNANLAYTEAFGVTGINTDGRMTWDKANEWIAAMNTAGYLGETGWRLPFVVDTNDPGCDVANFGTDCGYNVQTMSGSTVYSEMAHLFYVTLGNLALYDTSGEVQPNWGLLDSGPFVNLMTSYPYWSGTEYADRPNNAWIFRFNDGYQHYDTQTNEWFVWAVNEDDIGTPVPLPAAAWLLLSGIAGLGFVARRGKKGTVPFIVP